MMKNTKMEKPMTEKANQKEKKELSPDELEKVTGGFSLRHVQTVEPTDIGDDTESKV